MPWYPYYAQQPKEDISVGQANANAFHLMAIGSLGSGVEELGSIIPRIIDLKFVQTIHISDTFEIDTEDAISNLVSRTQNLVVPGRAKEYVIKEIISKDLLQRNSIIIGFPDDVPLVKHYVDITGKLFDNGYKIFPVVFFANIGNKEAFKNIMAASEKSLLRAEFNSKDIKSVEASQISVSKARNYMEKIGIPICDINTDKIFKDKDSYEQIAVIMKKFLVKNQKAVIKR